MRFLGSIAGTGSAPTGVAGGDLGGTYPNPTVVALEETGSPARLAIGAIANGRGGVRVGSTFVGGRVHQSQAIVVGNSVAGDTAADCDFLDVGDGVQLAAALAAAGSAVRQDVWIKPGSYTLASTFLTVPTSVHVRGSNRGFTQLVLTGTQRKALSLGIGSTVEGITISVPVPTAGAAGTEVIELATTTRLRDVDVFMTTQNAAQAALETITACIRTVAADAGVHCDRVVVTCATARNVGVAKDIKAFEIQSRIVTSPSTLVGCRVQNGDIGFDLEGAVSCYGWHFLGAGRMAARLGASSGTTASRVGPTLHGGFAYITNIAGLAQYGVELYAGSDATGMVSAKVLGNTFLTTSVNVASAGIQLSGIGNGAICSDNTVRTFPLGINVAATQVDATVSGTLFGYTTAVTDASGSLQNNTRAL